MQSPQNSTAQLLKMVRSNVKAAAFMPYHFFRMFKATNDFSFSIKTSLGKLGEAKSDEIHLKESMGWLARSQDVCEGKGSSIKYSLYAGWDPNAYPETTGYILETFLDYARFTKDPTYLARAVRAGDWEIEIQHTSGGVLSAVRDPNKLRVFNTGQVMHGWCRLFEETKEKRFLQAAVKAADYLLAQQEKNGSWIKDTYDHGPRTYQTRTSWALLRTYVLTQDKKYLEAAYKNIEWSLAQQQENGWFKNCGLAEDLPITHVIAYTLRGLIETYLLIQEGKLPAFSGDLLAAIIKACDGYCTSVEQKPALGIKGLPHCSYDSNWQSVDSHSCLTGNAQMAGILFKLSKITGSTRYQKNADQILDTTKRTQNLVSTVDGIRGGLAGSFPMYRGYASDFYPNWATKFMADALLMRIQKQGTP